jgi:hypothetical protein
MPHGQDMGRALEAQRRAEVDFFASLPTADLTRASSFEHWSGKDLLNHITSWKEQAAMRLRGDPTAVPDETNEQVDAANAHFFETARALDWEAISQKAEAVHRDLMHAFENLPQASLDDPTAGGWRTGLPLWRTLASNTIGHSFSHLIEHALERQDRQQGLLLVQQMVQAMKPISSDPGYQGAVDYNAGCLLARAGEIDAALDLLAAGLRARPDLVEWSKQDPDLESLRPSGALDRLHAALAG